MSYFKAKMHQIRFRLEFVPRPRWGSSQRSPDSLADFKGLRTMKYIQLFLQFWLFDKMLI